eukprot:4489501-Pleurochrysis_carterae.AAC.1
MSRPCCVRPAGARPRRVCTQPPRARLCARYAWRIGYSGELARRCSQRALREDDPARARLLEGGAHPREQPQRGMVVEPWPPRPATP